MQTVASNRYEIERAVLDADLVIGAVLVPGAKAPTLVSNDLVSRMKPGSGAGRHLDRPGRLLRGLAADHARRPDLPGARLGLLLRREHAGRGAAHLDVRADQRDAAVRRGAGRPGLAARRCATTTSLALGLNTHDGDAHLRAGRRGARAASTVDARRGARPERCAAASRATLAARGRRLPRPPGGRARAGAPTRWRRTGATCAATSRSCAGRGVDDVGRRAAEAHVSAVPGRGCARATTEHPPLARRQRGPRGRRGPRASTGSLRPRGAGDRRPGARRCGRRRRRSGCRRRCRSPTSRRILDAAGAAGHAAGAARPGAARAALRHRRADLRGGRARRRRPRPRASRRGPAARQGQQGAGRAGRLVRRGGAWTAYLVRGAPGAGRGRAAGRRRCSSTPAAAGCRGRAPGRCWRRRPSGPA